jgi:hypothetical protein
MMGRPAARVLRAVCFLLGAYALGGAASAEDTLVWTGTTNGSLIALTYGPIDTSKPPTFLLTCFNEMDVAVLEIFGVIEGTRPGQKLTIELSAGDAKASLAGEASLDDKTGSMFAEASDIKLDPVLAVLKAPGPATVKTAGTTRTLSDTGRAEAIESFTKDCQID